MNKLRNFLLLLALNLAVAGLYAKDNTDQQHYRKESYDALFYNVMNEFAKRYIHKEYGESTIIMRCIRTAPDKNNIPRPIIDINLMVEREDGVFDFFNYKYFEGEYKLINQHRKKLKEGLRNNDKMLSLPPRHDIISASDKIFNGRIVIAYYFADKLYYFNIV